MKNAILILFFVIANMLFAVTVARAATWVSPRPGEGIVHLAERYGADPREFVKLNKELGKFTNPKRIALIYTWQKFMLTAKTGKQFNHHAAAGAKIGKKVFHESKNITTLPPTLPEEKIPQGALKEAHESNNETRCSFVQAALASLSTGVSGLQNENWAHFKISPKATFFLSFFALFLFTLLLILLYYRKAPPPAFDALWPDEKPLVREYFLGYHLKSKKYCIALSDYDDTNFKSANTISEIAKHSFEFAKQQQESALKLFTCRLGSNKESHSYRELTAEEEKQYTKEIEILSIIDTIDNNKDFPTMDFERIKTQTATRVA